MIIDINIRTYNELNTASDYQALCFQTPSRDAKSSKRATALTLQ